MSFFGYNVCTCAYGGSCHICKPEEWDVTKIHNEHGTVIMYQKKKEVKIKNEFITDRDLEID